MRKLLFQIITFPAILVIISFALPVFAGNGARHPIGGAMYAKYLSLANRKSDSSKLLSYGSAFFLGMYSHLLSDHFGNYEPRINSKEMIYFSAEGVAGIYLLLPLWKKDPRLFWGSVGGFFPDIEHTLRLFGKRVFPTHSGLVTHGELEYFWHGAIENLILDGIAYYAISKDILPQNGGSPLVRMGWSLNYWHTQGALEKGFPEYAILKMGSLLRDVNLIVDLHNFLSLETCWGTWTRWARDAGSCDIPGSVVIQSHLVGFTLHPRQGKAVLPFLTAGTGLYIASRSDPVDSGGIAFARYSASKIGVHLGGGIRIPVKKSICVVISQRYHYIKFSKNIDGSRNFSGWAGGIILERGL